MPRSRLDMLETLATYVLGRAREMIPQDTEITIVLHNDGDWSATSTLRGADLDRVIKALQTQRPPAAPEANRE